jgi:hypothetical protein
MGFEKLIKFYECDQCPYGCKGHSIMFDGSTTSNTARLFLDDKPITPYLTYDDFEAIKQLLNGWNVHNGAITEDCK